MVFPSPARATAISAMSIDKCNLLLHSHSYLLYCTNRNRTCEDRGRTDTILIAHNISFERDFKKQKQTKKQKSSE